MKLLGETTRFSLFAMTFLVPLSVWGAGGAAGEAVPGVDPF